VEATCALDVTSSNPSKRSDSIVVFSLKDGVTMKEMRRRIQTRDNDVFGIVTFARGKCSYWIKPVFQLEEWSK